MSDAALPPKREVATALLGKGSLFVHLDPRLPGVFVPEWLKQQPQLVLQVGLQMLIPIPDLRVDEEGVFGTLSFSRTPFACLVPWHAVFALVGDDGRGMVWPESMPAEIASEVEREAVRAKRSEAEHASPSPQLRSSRLASVPPSAAPHKSSPEDGPRVASIIGTNQASAKRTTPKLTPPPKRRELPPYLRVVK